MYRMERGAYTVKAERIDLLPLLAEVLTELETTLSAHKVKADIRIRGVLAGPGAGFFVIGERLLCWALLYHLVQNAVEASPPGEHVHIHFDEDKSCCVSVHNMGMVPDKIRDTLFDKFITEGKKEGTGLGAYCARLVVQTLGGSISYTSTKAEGTTMRVRLPLPPSGCF
jgi:signal transduction histidine kinase